MSWWHRVFNWKPQSSLTLREKSLISDSPAQFNWKSKFQNSKSWMLVSFSRSHSIRVLLVSIVFCLHMMETGCPPRVLSPPPCWTQSWRPCLPGQVNRLPSPEPSWLYDWFIRAGRGSQLRSAPVSFFPEVHEELTKSWMAPFTARIRLSASSILTTLDDRACRGYAAILQVEKTVAVHLCPQNASTWRNRLCLTSWPLLSRSKLIVLWARQLLPCKPRLCCRYTKSRRLNKWEAWHTGGMACTAQHISLAHVYNLTRLRNSVRQTTSKVQRRSRNFGGSPERSCLAWGDFCPPG